MTKIVSRWRVVMLDPDGNPILGMGNVQGHHITLSRILTMGGEAIHVRASAMLLRVMRQIEG